MPTNEFHKALWRERLSSSSPEINTLISAYPDSLMEKDENARTPLFVALENRVPLEIVQLLIDACPDAILECDGGGDLPVQYMIRQIPRSSCEEAPDISTYIRALVEANPACLQLGEAKNGGLPMHWAAVSGVGLETFKVILEGFSQACQTMDGGDHIPLECALHAQILPDFEVIEALVSAFPEALKVKVKSSRHGLYLMHMVCARYMYALTETFVLTVKESCPGAFLIADGNGCVPLHYMVVGEPEHEAIQTAALAMIRACPEAASVAAEYGQLPLHHSMGNLNARVTHVLVEANPDAVVAKAGDMEQTPLHLLLENPETFSLEVAKVLVAARPDALMVTDSDGNIPLAMAVENNADLPTVEWLINAQPESLKSANNFGRIPLHIAVCEAAASLELVRMLYHAWPDSAKQADCDGKLPLCHAVIYDSQETFEFLHEVCPEATRAKDNAGMLPLHHAVDGFGRPEKFEFLLQAYPEAVTIKDNERGMLPLHHAARNCSLNSVTALVAAWPESVKEPDMEGDMPLFLAFTRHHFNEGIVNVLLEAWPDSIQCTNSVGDLPIHMVSRLQVGCLSGEVTDVFARAKYLIDTWPESLLLNNRDGDLPLHVLLSQMKSEENGRKRKRDDVVNDQLNLVRLFVSKCPESVEVVDGEGSIPLIVASQNDNVSLDTLDFLTKASMNVLPTSRTGRFPASEV